MRTTKRLLTGVITFLTATTMLVGTPGEAWGGSIASAAARAAARQMARQTPKPTDVLIRRSKHPAAAAHIEHAQRMGQPTILTIDRAHAQQQRAQSLKHIARKPETAKGMDRDEYPFAMTREGGANANVRYIDAGDNRGAGKSLGHQTRDLPEGARIRVLIGD